LIRSAADELLALTGITKPALASSQALAISPETPVSVARAKKSARASFIWTGRSRLTVPVAVCEATRIVSVSSRAPDTGLEASFQEMAAALEPVLYATALRLCDDPADARDLVQDTFERGLRRIGQLPRGSNVRGWLTTILHNRFIDLCRVRAREPLAPLEEAEELATPDPASSGWEATTAEELIAAVGRLDEDLREVCQLHGLERRPYKEVSRRLGIPMGTVATRLARARQRLRALLLGTPEGQE
jgi:RNA polymerase sigma-70 factor (ECF subfamily)